MFYEINISLNGMHFFATHERSILSDSQLKEVLTVLQKKFTENEGYTIMVTRYTKHGEKVEFNDGGFLK